MILFPAIDIKDGRCVRLRQGREADVTVFSTDPEAMALHWAGLGAKWLHVVDLDGAFSGIPKNARLIGRICSRLDIPVQLGGGIRDRVVAEAYLEAGVRRLIIGTKALVDPDGFGAIVRAFPGCIGVSLDAVDGRLKIRGWVDDAGLGVEDVLPRLAEQGVSFLVYTDISRDGMQTGVNLPAMERLLALTDLPVIAAGGVATLDDVAALYPLHAKGLAGVVTGRAIYAGTLDFTAALDWIERQ
ncbi:1-(5-phosphoribosyl)-5-[(5-phosphoribosylamino)methylideneamino]imidazole-4-carboxamide isomerase [Desulfolutivibrio sulfoxidireducens]|uniref:1-(5-phosphoribosyl)-5-[(5- phosphoribosylamino)methylideneamino]imidazole-4- carboxamide isomerase n=1 Tax=Desulfolutivibrio sulfoxidireducens TaxID=2773299 RepID=UPI00159DED75|nr:1-(5-phosphoribosyl)-5-[(5-phosphoribosylamino)methylideneamino]imidazole-4-carboxamide isomerase [Desulfolutivibrio sulfoxidireducens]QLA15604.1 1-(5-phosphoribosyl)-5-[(5-phosphoribosylamino)methylideneamino]imidazole-4-carboxamide isomerase [Desulfolutivibrio sulfoxidireducens]QLA19208.1 1-(5-phosphoribosyl)-5-[(5-phosphoribosylamino)methylideneamino]imidazole-4-carboxamide isomerase [Desulfolutivibrio sulfoxidireducens]